MIYLIRIHGKNGTIRKTTTSWFGNWLCRKYLSQLHDPKQFKSMVGAVSGKSAAFRFFPWSKEPTKKWRIWKPFHAVLNMWFDQDTDPMHDHESWNMSVVLVGRAIEETEKGERRLGPGSIIFRRPGVKHRFKPERKRRLVWTLFIYGRFYDEEKEGKKSSQG